MRVSLGPATESVLDAAGLDLRAGLAFEGHDAVLIGNTVALWPHFVAWLRAEPGRVERAHPLDTYVGERVAAALGSSRSPVLRVIWPYEPGAPGFVALAVEAGLLWRSPGGLGIHPVYGPWVALRALVVVDGAPPAASCGPSEPVGRQAGGVSEPAPPCPSCETACGPAWAALSLPDSEAAFRREWRAWADARRACPTGAVYRYSEEQSAYHYTHDREIIRRLVRP